MKTKQVTKKSLEMYLPGRKMSLIFFLNLCNLKLRSVYLELSPKTLAFAVALSSAVCRVHPTKPRVKHMFVVLTVTQYTIARLHCADACTHTTDFTTYYPCMYSVATLHVRTSTNIRTNLALGTLQCYHENRTGDVARKLNHSLFTVIRLLFSRF